MESGPAAAQEVSSLLASIKPTLPVLLSNMTALGQVAVTYLPGLRQLMVLLPPAVAFYQSSRGVNNATGSRSVTSASRSVTRRPAPWASCHPRNGVRR